MNFKRTKNDNNYKQRDTIEKCAHIIFISSFWLEKLNYATPNHASWKIQ